MNVYDSRKIVDLLVDKDFERTFDSHDADILIFYTCNIREKSAQKLLSNIGFLKTTKTKVIAVGGCVAQAEKDGLFKIKHINIVFGPQTYHRLPEHIEEILNGQKARILDIGFDQKEKFNCFPSKKEVNYSEFVTIQEGCDNFCAYCVVPYTRGREYSRPVKDVISEVKELLLNGAKEIILIGQNVNSYLGEAPYINIGKPKGVWKLERLIQELADLEGLKRLRYTTSHPKDFTDELMEVHAKTPVLVPFTHIPIQSGNDRILKIMNRGHTRNEYLNKLEKFKNICPDIKFSSDFIVGFPTETDEEFEDTVRLAKIVKYVVSYSFKYSRRKNTPADKMDGQIGEEVKKKRLALLQDAILENQVYQNNNLVGKRQEVLFEKKGKKSNQYIGKNVYSQSVVAESEESLIGEFRSVLINSAGINSVAGTLS
jgi:tRNA-2-methylthio-N6-dimethylallyladenosine synthase